MAITNPAHTGFHTAFMRHVGLGRRFSVAKIAEMVGVSPSYAQKWLEGVRAPCANRLAQLMAILGPAFVNHYLNPIKMGGVMPLDDEPACPRQAVAASAEATSFLATAMADGVIDRNEQAQIADLQDRASRLARNVRMGHCG